MQIQCVAMHRFRIALQLFTAVSKSKKSSNSGPFMLILSKLSRVLVFNRFLTVVLILFIEEIHTSPRVKKLIAHQLI